MMWLKFGDALLLPAAYEQCRRLGGRLMRAGLFSMACMQLCPAAGLRAQPSAGVSDDGRRMERAGLVDVLSVDGSLVVRLLYAGADNFVGEVLYGNLREAYLQADAARQLAAAQRALRASRPGHSLVVYDAARPRAAQLLMWNKVKDTDMRRYVASPQRVSMHSYGVAVDVSILDGDGLELDMGTPVDFLDALAEPRREREFLEAGKLSRAQLDNRLLLRAVMRGAGFHTIPNEWWHFEACTREEARRRYVPVD